MITLPSDEILLRYVSGAIDPALRMLVQRHIELHPQTRDNLRDFEKFGGELLAGEAGADWTAGSLDRALARLSGPEQQTSVPPRSFPALDTLRWRWAGPGRAIANIDVPDSRLKTCALRIAPGKAMLQHSHEAQEWTLIVQGSYRDASGEYDTGAFIEEDEETDHRPVATGNVECICLAVMSGPLTAPGVMGKVARWMMR